MSLTRAKFESLTDELFARLRSPVEACLKDANATPDKIDEVILVGGATRMPRAQQICREIFYNKELHQGVNPDEVVAVGAAIQGAVLSGEVQNVVLLDVTPLSLGVETLGGVMTPLIPRNSTIPTRKSEIFSTAADSQPAVDVHVLQGERKLAADNRTLGRFQLSGIPPAPRGTPQIEVTFDIDANGILNVSAKDKATNKEQKVEIKASSGLNKDEVERMVKEAAGHEAEDRRRGELIEARNRADQLAHQTEKFIKENEAQISPTLREQAGAAIRDVRSAIEKGVDKNALDAATKNLELVSQKISEEMYKAAQSAGAGASSGRTGSASSTRTEPRSSPHESDVVDAEYKEVDENK
jgi:molecular chaperone DnaK